MTLISKFEAKYENEFIYAMFLADALENRKNGARQSVSDQLFTVLKGFFYWSTSLKSSFLVTKLWSNVAI